MNTSQQQTLIKIVLGVGGPDLINPDHMYPGRKVLALRKEVYKLERMVKAFSDSCQRKNSQIAELTQALKQANNTNLLFSGRIEKLEAEKFAAKAAEPEWYTLGPDDILQEGDHTRVIGAPDSAWERVDSQNWGRYTYVRSINEFRRRKVQPTTIKPGEGYRLLEVGEEVQFGDEVRWADPSAKDNWDAIAANGGWPGTVLAEGNLCVFRRKIEPAEDTEGPVVPEWAKERTWKGWTPHTPTTMVYYATDAERRGKLRSLLVTKKGHLQIETTANEGVVLHMSSVAEAKDAADKLLESLRAN